jgi:general secretion pathway protein E/type IV pilus assembly protein PilB
VPAELAERYNVFPVELRGRVLRLAISDPLDSDAIDSLSHVLKLTIEPVIAPPDAIRLARSRYYDSGDIVSSVFQGMDQPDVTDPGEAAIDAATGGKGDDADAPIIKLVQMIIGEAFRRRASDIHLEPLEKRFRLRYRIDGVLIEVDNPPKRLQLSVVSRLKIMANISIAEKRIPQDGRIQINVDGKLLDLRVSSLPTVHGESIVMRILDKSGLRLGLPELGFLSDDQAVWERLISLPDGIILVTGPTGSGKTTTLYSCLHFINKPDRKIITVEDPVEYQLGGINQVPVRADIGMTFAAALRAMLRQAPNIVMVGEIRDLETAEIAINASLTGHMVFSTLHTNDAPSAVTRLIDIGVKPFLVSASLRATMAQRLVRKICKACKRPYAPSSQELRALNITKAQAASATFMKGAGCSECNRTGYKGRMGIFEVFLINEELQRMIYEGAPSAKLRQKARVVGMRSMREDGVRKVLGGMTTIDEVVSITVGDVD